LTLDASEFPLCASFYYFMRTGPLVKESFRANAGKLSERASGQMPASSPRELPGKCRQALRESFRANAGKLSERASGQMPASSPRELPGKCRQALRESFRANADKLPERASGQMPASSLRELPGKCRQALPESPEVQHFKKLHSTNVHHLAGP
jgi:hypothetical protein